MRTPARTPSQPSAAADGRPGEPVDHRDQRVRGAGQHQAHRKRDGGQQAQRDDERAAQRGRIVLEPGERRRGHLADRLREHGDRPAGEVEGEHVEAERHGADHAADHELVDVLDGEDDDAGAGEREAELQELPRDLAIPAEADRLGPDEQHGAGGRAGEPPDPEAHRAHAADGGDDRDDRAEPVGDLVDQHPPAGAELALEQRGGGGDGAADDHAEREHPDDARGVRRAHGRAEPGRRRHRDGAEDDARQRSRSSPRSARSRAASRASARSRGSRRARRS